MYIKPVNYQILIEDKLQITSKLLITNMPPLEALLYGSKVHYRMRGQKYFWDANL